MFRCFILSLTSRLKSLQHKACGGSHHNSHCGSWSFSQVFVHFVICIGIILEAMLDVNQPISRCIVTKGYQSILNQLNILAYP